VRPQPLNVADPDHGLRQLVRVGVDLNAEELRWVDSPLSPHAAVRLSPVVDLILEVVQVHQRDVEEVAAAAGRVEDADGGDSVDHRVDGLLDRGLVLVALLPGLRGVALDDELLGLGTAGVPLASERAHQDRLDDGVDVVSAGVVGAELLAQLLVFLQRGLEERACDRRFDSVPLQITGGGEGVEVVGGERQRLGVGEEPAVEVLNAVGAEVAARRHLLEELADERGEVPGSLARVGYERAEDTLRQEADVLGEEAE
jgi:hypothetical protein